LGLGDLSNAFGCPPAVKYRAAGYGPPQAAITGNHGGVVKGTSWLPVKGVAGVSLEAPASFHPARALTGGYDPPALGRLGGE